MIHALSLSCQLTPDLDKPFINRHLSPYIHLLAPGVQHMGASYLLSVDTKPKSLNISTDESVGIIEQKHRSVTDLPVLPFRGLLWLFSKLLTDRTLFLL